MAGEPREYEIMTTSNIWVGYVHAGWVAGGILFTKLKPLTDGTLIPPSNAKGSLASIQINNYGAYYVFGTSISIKKYELLVPYDARRRLPRYNRN